MAKLTQSGNVCTGVDLVTDVQVSTPPCYRLQVKGKEFHCHQCFVSDFPGWRLERSIFVLENTPQYLSATLSPPKFKHKVAKEESALPLRYGYKQVTIPALSSVSPFLVFLLHHQ